MEDKILEFNQTLGFITYKDLIKDLESILKDVKLLDEIFYSVLKNSELDDEDISTFFRYDIAGRIDWIIYVLKDLNQ